MIRVSIFNEFLHEKTEAPIRAIYPEGIHGAIRDFLQSDDISVRTFTLDNVNEITDEALDNTDVMLWWGHMGHHLVPDEVALRVQEAVLKGMGAIFLHSAHFSKPFKLLMGTSCSLTWRENGDMERVWVTKPAHPIAKGLGRFITIPHEETYGEPFDIPEADVTVFIGGFEGGEVFRSGLCYRRGNGKIFYFQPGHESFPTYKIPDVQKVIKNAVHWAYPDYRVEKIECPQVSKP